MTCGEAFVHRRSFNVPTLLLNCGGEPSVCSKKHFYLFCTKAKKVKVAKEVSCKLLHKSVAPFLKMYIGYFYGSTGHSVCQFKKYIIFYKQFYYTVKNIFK